MPWHLVAQGKEYVGSGIWFFKTGTYCGDGSGRLEEAEHWAGRWIQGLLRSSIVSSGKTSFMQIFSFFKSAKYFCVTRKSDAVQTIPVPVAPPSQSLHSNSIHRRMATLCRTILPKRLPKLHLPRLLTGL